MIWERNYNLDINSIKQLIYDSEIISFDIFDTLLLRPYSRPVDLFKHIEYIYKAENFCEERILAERNARKSYSNQEDITYDQIYEFIPDKYKGLQIDELNLEKQILTPNLQMKEVFEYAKSLNKKIIIVSDMYLPAKELSDILISKGFSGFHKIYVSGDLGKTKYRGSLYQLIIDEYGVSPDKILHLGDNNKSDYEIPLSFGMKAINCEKVLDKLFKINHRAQIFYNRQNNNLGASIILGVLSIILNNSDSVDIETNYWKYFGCLYGGPICYSFIKWVQNEIGRINIDTLLFIARDGYVLQKVFNMVNPNSKVNIVYLYAPRFLALSIIQDYLKQVFSNNIYLASSTIKAFLKMWEKEYEETCEFKSVDAGLNFIKEHKSDFQNIADKYTAKYKKYLAKLSLDNKNVGIVDTISTFFTAQKMLDKLLNRKNLALYWCVNRMYLNEAQLFYKFKTFDVAYYPSVHDWRIMEFIMTSPEAPIEDINEDGSPCYKVDLSDFEKDRIIKFQIIEEGILFFTSHVLQIFGNLEVFLSNKIVTDWINLFCDISTPFEKEQFSRMMFATDVLHSNYKQFPTKWFQVNNRKRKITNLEKVFSVRNEDRQT